MKFIISHISDSDYPSGKIYTDNDQMITDLADRFVDGILIDSLVAADMADKLSARKLKIAKLIPEPAGWGIILSGELLRMETEIRSYVKFSQDMIKNMVENATDGKLEVYMRRMNVHYHSCYPSQTKFKQNSPKLIFYHNISPKLIFFIFVKITSLFFAKIIKVGSKREGLPGHSPK